MLLGRLMQRLMPMRHCRQPWIFACSNIHAQAQCQNTDSGFKLQYINNIAILHMDKNVMDGNFVKNMNVLLDSVESNKSCLALATIGNSKFYSNGLDLKYMETLSPEDLVTFIHDAKRLLHRILLFPMPTLAILNGSTYAFGAFLAFAHDIRTMSTDKTVLSFTAVREKRRVSGFIRDYLKIKLGGGKNVADALILARHYKAKDAHKSLLVHAIHPEASLLDYSLQVLESFLVPGPFPREGILGMKSDIYKQPIDSFVEDLNLKRPFFVVQYMTPTQLANYKA
ncbi:enoyl-CoA delta isomerase 2 peroxisomal [Biomphalaria glabrata]